MTTETIALRVERHDGAHGFDDPSVPADWTIEQLTARVAPKLRYPATDVSSGKPLRYSMLHGPRAPASVHTHLHLDETADADAATAVPSPRDARPVISIDDIVTHYTAFPDPLSAALILSLFPGRRVLSIYGYTAQAQLACESGYWLMAQ
jgi:hypothetical protein